MPDCLVVAGDERAARRWILAAEDLGESWRCSGALGAEQAEALLKGGGADLLLLEDCAEARRLLELLAQRPPLCPPFVLAAQPHPLADGVLPASAPGLAAFLERCRGEGLLPRLALMRHGQMCCLARGLMRSLRVPQRLGAWAFLADMAAVAAVHPPLTEDLRRGLYPLMARRHGLTPAAVERRLRLAIEATWSGAELSALERFFGHSVDPERGKPTNREFLCRVQEHLLLAARRVA